MPYACFAQDVRTRLDVDNRGPKDGFPRHGLLCQAAWSNGQSAAGLETRQARTPGASNLARSAEAPAKRRLTLCPPWSVP